MTETGVLSKVPEDFISSISPYLKYCVFISLLLLLKYSKGGDDENSDNEHEAFPDDVPAEFCEGAGKKEPRAFSGRISSTFLKHRH